MAVASPARAPRRFRRRLLAVMLAAGLLPLLTLGALGSVAVSRALSLSPRRLDEVLQRADAALVRGAADPAVRDELRLAQISLVQAELARQSLSHLLPAALLVAAALGAAALAAAAVALGRALSRPVEDLAADMGRIAQGQLELPERALPLAGSDELQFLQRELRRMAAQLHEQRKRLAVSEGLAAWREVAQKLAHELKNPLTAMKMALARLSRGPAPGADGARIAESVALLDEELGVLLRLTQGFATFARLPAPEQRPLDLAPLLGEVCALYRGAGPVDIECRVDGALPLQGDADQLRRALGNLVKNALEASRAGDGPVRVLASADEEAVRVRIDDAGGGIGRALSGAELTSSLGTTKAGGSGLGLPIAHKIVHDHGGSLRLSPLPRGTRAEVELPRRAP